MNKYSVSINEAKLSIKNTTDFIHDYYHALSVVETIKEIVSFYPQVSKDLLETAGWWHDVGRLASDIDHEKLSASLAAKSLKKNGFSNKDQGLIKKAIMFHKWSMKPQTIEGEILRDADKLDFISVKRWKMGIKTNQLIFLIPIVELLPRLRNEILHLEESKRLFNEKMPIFITYISSIKSKDLKVVRLKEKILKTA